MYGYSEAEALQMNAAQLIPPGLRPQMDEIVHRLRRGERVDSCETQRVGKSGRGIDVWLTASLLKDDKGAAIAVSTTERDITQLVQSRAILETKIHERTAELEAKNDEIRAEIAERRALERQLLEVAAAEQRRIGQDLHDGVGQELTGLSLMAQSLLEILPDRSRAEAKIAAKIADVLQRAVRRVRILSRGLIPVEVDAEGLMAALGELAGRTSELHAVDCRFECPEPAFVEDNNTATHLYQIAQEAVTNALKHGHVKQICIGLHSDEDALTLSVRDDGVGLPEAARDTGGLGLKIMRYRAGLINAAFEIGPADGGGTLVKCILHKDKKP
jgi:PAS domain S-box-containing protein